jgi:hypothetical protein
MTQAQAAQQLIRPITFEEAWAALPANAKIYLEHLHAAWIGGQRLPT